MKLLLTRDYWLQYGLLHWAQLCVAVMFHKLPFRFGQSFFT